MCPTLLTGKQNLLHKAPGNMEAMVITGRTGYVFQLMREKGKGEKTRAHRRLGREVMHRLTVTLSWRSMKTPPMNGKRRKER